MNKKLRCWNGRWLDSNGHDRINICAYSRADAIRLIEEYTGYKTRSLNSEIKDYWSECWGRDMNGITPERGIWFSNGYGKKRIKPHKVFPK